MQGSCCLCLCIRDAAAPHLRTQAAASGSMRTCISQKSMSLTCFCALLLQLSFEKVVKKTLDKAEQQIEEA